MPREFDEILDECVDRMVRGETLDDCLAAYPEHAAELEPLLRAVADTRDPMRFAPSPQSKAAAKQRFSSALARNRGRDQSRRSAFPLLPRWSMAVAAVAAVVVVVLVTVLATGPASAPEGPGVVAAANFRLLISDQPNAILDFDHLYVEVTSIGVQQGNESGSWITLDPNPDPDGDGIPGFDLRPLTGENALEIWSGNLTAGEYSKMFLYVGNVTGILAGNETAVTLPSGKLQISKPFTVGDSVVNFVYDITVHKAGNSGTYILSPQIAESGPDKSFIDVSPKAHGRPESPGKSEDAGKPETPGNSENAGNPQNAGRPWTEFEGNITSLDPLVIGNTTVVFGNHTQVKNELGLGLRATVEGDVQQDGSVLAFKIRVEKAQQTGKPEDAGPPH